MSGFIVIIDFDAFKKTYKLNSSIFKFEKFATK